MPIVITLTQRTDGMDRAEAEWNAQRFNATSRNGATMALARSLVAAGCPDQPWIACWPDGRRRLSGPSFHNLARFTVKQGEGRPLIVTFSTPGDTVDGLKSETGPGDRAEA